MKAETGRFKWKVARRGRNWVEKGLVKQGGQKRKNWRQRRQGFTPARLWRLGFSPREIIRGGIYRIPP